MYTAREVTNVLGLSASRLRSYVRAGFISPERDESGEMRFSFRDLVLLRRAEGLVGDQVSARRVTESLRRLRERVSDFETLAGVNLRAEGRHIIVDDGHSRWRADDGQVLLDLQGPRAPAARHSAAAAGGTISPLALARAERSQAMTPLVSGDPPGVGAVAPALNDPNAPLPANVTAQDLYERGCALEEKDVAAAREAYRRAIALDPDHADAHVNLGRLLHEAGHPEAAQIHYRLALTARPTDSTAAFNLGVALEDLLRRDDAIAAYECAITNDPGNADAHYNLARLLEQSGRPEIAIRHLLMYRQLTKKR